MTLIPTKILKAYGALLASAPYFISFHLTRIQDAHIVYALHELVNMQMSYDLEAPKRATNLSINGDLLNQARALNINLSATLEKTLAAMVKAKQQQAWLAENQQVIDAYNQQADENGTFGDSLRVF